MVKIVDSSSFIIVCGYFKELFKDISNYKNISIADVDIKTDINLSLNLSISLQILHSKYIKILQNILPETEKYHNFLQIEDTILSIYNSAILFYEKIKSKEYKRRKSVVLLCYLNLIYNKSLKSIEKKYKFIDKYSDSYIDKSKATLYYIYNLLANNNFEKGKRELIKSEHYMDHPNGYYYICTEELAILYNQVLAKLGYISFINLDIENTFWSLNELCQLDNPNMVLGQYPVEGSEHLLVPFHQHIDVNLLLEFYLICCIILNKKSISKLYSAILYKYENEPLLRSVDTIYEKIFRVSQLLTDNEWEESYEIINTLHYFKDLDNNVKLYIRNSLKMTAIELYINQSKEFYKNIYLQDIIDKFSITYDETKSKISEMIQSKELEAVIDEGILEFNYAVARRSRDANPPESVRKA